MTPLKFALTSTGAEIIASCSGKRLSHPGILSLEDRHDLCGGTIAAEQFCHDFHRSINMLKECFIASTEIIESGLTIGRLDKTVLGTLAVTGKTHLTFTTVPWQTLALSQSKLPLLIRSNLVPGRAYFFPYTTARRKKSSPINVGSPPCQAIVTSGPCCASINWRI